MRDSKVTLKDLNWKKNKICYTCGEKGHYSNECPKRSVKQSHVQWSDGQDNEKAHMHAFQNFVVSAKEGMQFQQYEEPSEMKNWILLDTGSSTDIFCDRRLLNDVKHQPVGLTLHTNGGILKSNQAGELDQYGHVWHEKRALTNIFSFYNLQKKFHVTFDNHKDDSFHVFTADQKEILFSPSKTGIYRYDNSCQDFCFNETVAENKKMYSRRQIERANAARKLYHAIGNPSTKDFRAII